MGNNPADASWEITDENNNVVASRNNTNVKTTYIDTVTLHSGNFYKLSVTTLQCAGLNWWALAGQTGYTAGSLGVINYTSGNSLLALNGTSNSGTYKDDFGCGFVQYFATAGQCRAATPTITQSGDTLISTRGLSYQWYKNGNPIAGATGRTYGLGVVNGNYTVEVTDANGCVATSESFVFVSTGVNTLSDYAASVAIYPNPANDIFNITISAELTGTAYSIYDMTGRLMMNGKLNNEVNQISVRDIATGIYLVAISDGITSLTKRLVIQK